ncbi:hypothetical protein Tco_1025642, partial [Tanacetum coccineum]
TMADMNILANDVPAKQAPAIAPSTRTDDQILPLLKWVPINKSRLEPSTQIFLRFPQSYIYQFCEHHALLTQLLGYYNCQVGLDPWFNLHKDNTKDALSKSPPITDNIQFVAPPSSDAVIEYVNTLGYPCTLRNVSAMSVNDLYQPWRAILSMINMCLTEVQGKGKEKVIEEQAARNLLTLQTLKKKSPADQYIFQRCTPMTTGPSGNVESPSLDAGLALADSETESDEIVTPVNKEKDASNKELTEINAGVQDEGQVGSNPSKQDKGQARANPGNATEFQPQPSHVVHAGQNLEPMDLAVSDASTQQNPEQMDEEFTITAYPNVQENLKLPTEDQVILEEPVSSTRTMSSLQNLEKELSFTDQFFMEKPQEEEPEKTNAKSEVQSMVTVPIHQDTSSVPLMTTPVIDLTTSQSDSTTVHAPLLITTAITTTTTLPPPPPQP